MEKETGETEDEKKEGMGGTKGTFCASYSYFEAKKTNGKARRVCTGTFPILIERRWSIDWIRNGKDNFFFVCLLATFNNESFGGVAEYLAQSSSNFSTRFVASKSLGSAIALVLLEVRRELNGNAHFNFSLSRHEY